MVIYTCCPWYPQEVSLKVSDWEPVGHWLKNGIGVVNVQHLNTWNLCHNCGFCHRRVRNCFSSVQTVQLLSRVPLFVTACLQHARLPYPSPTPGAYSNLLKLMSIESVMPFNHLFLCRPLLFLPSIFPSFGVFSNESVLHIR